MLIAGVLLTIVAIFLHAWYTANSQMPRGHAAGAFFILGRGIAYAAIILLIIALLCIWVGGSAWLVLIDLGVCIGLRFLSVRLLEHVYVPAKEGETSDAEWRKRELKWAKMMGPNKKSAPTPNVFWVRLFEMLTEAAEGNEAFLDVTAAELHKRAGGYPGSNHRMPICCRVMREEMKDGDIVLSEPPKGAGASLTIRYQLPHQF